jgi:hypothetical protein
VEDIKNRFPFCSPRKGFNHQLKLRKKEFSPHIL